jgi:hypothetical protein
MYILHCPHCGGDACLNQNYNYRKRTYFVYVKCEMCGAQGKTFTSEEEPQAAGWDNQPCRRAINAWNMRTDSRDKDEYYDY